MTADEVVRILGLVPHPEGGWFAETWRDVDPSGGRGASSAIYYLLERGRVSAWHRIDATEIWHYYAGDRLRLSVSEGGRTADEHRLGPDLDAGERPQVTVPAGSWQSARTDGAWTLVGCTVAPAFVFDGFELAPEGWEPGEDRRAEPAR